MKDREQSGQSLPRSKWRILRMYWQHAAGFRWLLAVILVGLLLDGFLQAGMVNYLKVLIDRLLENPALFVRDTLPRMLVVGLAGAAVFFPIAYGGHVATSMLIARLVTSFRVTLYAHLQQLSISFYHQNRSGEIATRLTQDVENGVQTMTTFVAHGTWALAMILAALGSMLFLSWKLTLVFVALNAIYILLWRHFRRRIGKLSRQVRDQAGEVTAFATEDVSAILVMKSFASEDRFLSRFSHAQQRLYDVQVKAAKVNFRFSDILQAISRFLAPMAILGLGACLVEREGLTVGGLVAFWSYWTLVQVPLGILYGAGPGLASCMASMDRILEFLDQTPTPADRPGARAFTPVRGELEFRNVVFSYPGTNNREVIRGLNLTIPAHTSLGIVGPSGAGKSTLAQLVLRFFDPDKGSIRIDGVDLRDITQSSLRRNTGVVLQESLLLSGTIRENILLGDETAKDDRVWAALEQAGAADFVRAAQDGLDSIVGERGVTLSGGQRQRLCIARVFLKNPSLVIFDEATSALDTATEQLIHESMQRLLKGRTAILIAHRLSTILSCDRILMLNEGRVLGIVPHEELLSTCPEYAELVAKQDITRRERP